MQVLRHYAGQRQTTRKNLPEVDNLLTNGVMDLRDINAAIDTTDWLTQDSLGNPKVEKNLNHEPAIHKTLLDYLYGIERLK